MSQMKQTLLVVLGLTAFVGVAASGIGLGLWFIIEKSNPWTGGAILLAVFAFWMTPVVWWMSPQS